MLTLQMGLFVNVIVHIYTSLRHYYFNIHIINPFLDILCLITEQHFVICGV